MENQSYRQKSMDRVSSPEQMSDYIRVSNPGIWITLAAILILLGGAFVWSALGRLETVQQAVSVSEGGAFTCYVGESKARSLKAGAKIRIGEEEWAVSGMQDEPVKAESELSDYAMHLGGIQAGEWVYRLTADVSLAEGIYETILISESISPITFLLN